MGLVREGRAAIDRIGLLLDLEKKNGELSMI